MCGAFNWPRGLPRPSNPDLFLLEHEYIVCSDDLKKMMEPSDVNGAAISGSSRKTSAKAARGAKLRLTVDVASNGVHAESD